MLAHAPAQFPFPGSTALLDGLSFTVQRLNADGTATISRHGTGASFRRDAPIAELVDPAEAEKNATLAFKDEAQATARIALFATGYLRAANEIPLRELGIALRDAADQGRIPLYRDNSHLVRIMRKLGWRKDGYAGEGYERSPLYRRVVQPQG